MGLQAAAVAPKSTNIIENMMGTVRRVCRNVKRWRTALMGARDGRQAADHSWAWIEEERYESRIHSTVRSRRFCLRSTDGFRGSPENAPYSRGARRGSSHRDHRGLRQAGVPRNGRCARCRRCDDRGAAWRRRGIHTLDSAHDKAYTSVSFKNDTIALEERGKGEIAPLSKLPHVMFFGGGVVIKLGDETIGAIGASGAPGAKLDDNCAHAGLEKIRDRLN
jgi:uncharacterized protein GlcG (DUF336 family)